MSDMGNFDYRIPPEMQRKNKLKSVLTGVITVFVVLAVFAGGFMIWQNFGREPVVLPQPGAESAASSETESMPVQSESQPEEPEYQYKVGALQVTREREKYVDGDMKLIIPKLDIDIPVLSLPNPDDAGEDAVNKILNDGVGLFFCAQMPGPGNANVSIAGHRDIHGCEFFYLDTLTEGDRLFLEWEGKRYEYEYYETVIVHAADAPEVIWAPVMVKKFSALTLQTCTPIGIASHRMFVVGKLVGIEDMD